MDWRLAVWDEDFPKRHLCSSLDCQTTTTMNFMKLEFAQTSHAGRQKERTGAWCQSKGELIYGNETSSSLPDHRAGEPES